MCEKFTFFCIYLIEVWNSVRKSGLSKTRILLNPKENVEGGDSYKEAYFCVGRFVAFNAYYDRTCN